MKTEKRINQIFEIMKGNAVKSVLAIVLLMIFSCNEPETIVTNIVHPDGSVARRVEMRSAVNEFDPSDYCVPVDSSWSIRDTIEIITKDEKSDTTWIKIAEKKFESVEEINKEYSTDKGKNRSSKRTARFARKFKWFNTEFRFSENIDKIFQHGNPLKDYLNKEEMDFYFLPSSISDEKLQGPDSTKYKTLKDTIENKTETWIQSCLVSEWIGEFTRLIAGKAPEDLSKETLKKREPEVVKILQAGHDDPDSLIISEFLGAENYNKFKKESDSASAIIEKRFDEWSSFSNYSLKIIIPGKLLGTNGVMDKNGELVWALKSGYFFSEPYQMWVESKIPNTWAWIVSVIFLLFVMAGLIFRVIKK